ncbi:hypothetical protein DXG03_006245 [Asterophora parasitica]|uniref:Uncharacterized protein n=1 Tax=Asterophora parasitica TaxID=117018 RepID=A0A9P7KF05_9AGAR|nr:hypothetical protein DXG03_006245 [Asterophora parasitica]
MNGPIQDSVHSFARPVTNVTCVKLTSRLMREAIFPSPLDPCSVPKKTVENASGHHNIYGYMKNGTTALNPFK